MRTKEREKEWLVAQEAEQKYLHQHNLTGVALVNMFSTAKIFVKKSFDETLVLNSLVCVKCKQLYILSKCSDDILSMSTQVALPTRVLRGRFNSPPMFLDPQCQGNILNYSLYLPCVEFRSIWRIVGHICHIIVKKCAIQYTVLGFEPQAFGT